MKTLTYMVLITVTICISGCTSWYVQEDVSPEFPFQSKYTEVLDSTMHYVEEGHGDPILLLHGNPTSSYLWRNIIPYLSPYGRVIAVDLIGMGKSGKPDIDYRFVDHSRYLEAFIKKMDLKHITLVVHDWGSGLGFHYAMRHEDNIKGIAFMEAIIRPVTWDDFGIIEAYIFRKFRDPIDGPEWIVEDNFFIEKGMPAFTGRSLSDQEMNAYRRPFLEAQSRRPILVWPNEIPIEGEPADMHAIVTDYYTKLQQSTLPKLLLWADPGAIIKEDDVRHLKEVLPNLETRYVGKGIHYIQEDQPHNIGTALAEWIQTLSDSRSHSNL